MPIADWIMEPFSPDMGARTDDFGAKYELREKKGGAIGKAATLLRAAELLVKDDPQDFDTAISKANDALDIFRKERDGEAVTDALRLIVTATRLKADKLKHAVTEESRAEVKGLWKSALDKARKEALEFRKAGDKRGEAAMLLSSAEVNYSIGGDKKRDEALDAATAARKLLKEVGDSQLESRACFTLTNIHIKNEMFSDALEAGEAGLELFRKVGNRLGEAKCLHTLAVIYISKNEFLHGMTLAKNALDLFSDLGLRKWEGYECYMMSFFCLKSGRFSQSLPFAREALAIFHEVDMATSWQCQALQNIAEAQLGCLKLSEAKKAAAEALELAQGASDKRTELGALQMLTQVYLAMRDAEEAWRTAEEAMAIARGMGDKRAESHILNELARVHLARGDFDQAKQTVRDAVDMSQGAEEKHESGIILATLAEAMIKGSDWDGLKEVAVEQQTIFRETGDKGREATALLQIASCTLFGSEGDAKLAMELAEEAKAMFQDKEDKEGEARALMQIADLYQAQGERQLALESAEGARGILREINEKPDEARALATITKIHLDMDENGKAVRTANDALAVAKRTMDKRLEIEMSFLLTSAQIDLGILDGPAGMEKKYDKAMKPSKEALKLAKAVNNKELTAQALFMMGRVHMACMHIGDAIQIVTEALTIVRQLGDEPILEVSGVLQLSECYFMGQKKDRAMELANEALGLAEEYKDGEGVTEAKKLIDLIEGPKMVPAGTAGAAAGADDAAAAAAGGGADGAGPRLTHEMVIATIQDMIKQSTGEETDMELDAAFMDAGMDSLTAVSFRTGLQDQLGVKLPSSLIFDYPTVREVANRVVELAAEEDAEEAGE